MIGDDSQRILILDSQYRIIDSLQILSHSGNRIAKKEKPDFESSTILKIKGVDHLLVMGSGSRPLRKTVHLIPFEDQQADLSQHKILDTTVFVDRVAALGVEEINFEGVTCIGNDLVIGNRGNRTNITNHLIITEPDFWTDQEKVRLNLVALDIPALEGRAPGVSELCYEPTLDLLLVTLSNEETPNAYDDGIIGHSYIGWIKKYSERERESSLSMDGILCLTDISNEFEGEKIEGLCVECIEDGNLVLHLISDNDNGESKLFKIKMELMNS